MLVGTVQRHFQFVPGVDAEVCPEQIRVVRCRRGEMLERAREGVDDASGQLNRWHRCLFERRWAETVAVWQRGPELYAVEPPAVVTRGLFRVGNAGARRHDIDPTRPEHAFAPKTVVVDHFAIKQPGDCLESDVWVRRDIDRMPVTECQRAEPVQKTPGAHQPAVPDRQHARDYERAKAYLPARVRFQLWCGSTERHARLRHH